MELFLLAHQNYDYESLCDEIESLWRDQDYQLDAPDVGDHAADST